MLDYLTDSASSFRCFSTALEAWSTGTNPPILMLRNSVRLKFHVLLAPVQKVQHRAQAIELGVEGSQKAVGLADDLFDRAEHIADHDHTGLSELT